MAESNRDGRVTISNEIEHSKRGKKKLIEAYRENSARSFYQQKREMEEKRELNRGTIDGLKIEEKMRIGYYKF